jgi:hypothetical protein
MIKITNNLESNVSKEDIEFIVKNFNTSGELFIGGRNSIKLFKINEKTLNVKAFKVPNFINAIIYGFFRKSKAHRSFEYATLLLKKGIGTPEPIAYVENKKWFGLRESYYISEHLEVELTFRELVLNPNYPDHENILRQFTHFCFLLHENGIEFLDHSPGNTLIKKENDSRYSFYLVDLNRMKFHKNMNFSLRMKNLSHLTPKEEMVAIMSEEYAKLYSKTQQETFQLLWQYTSDFQSNYRRKKKIKAIIKFWKK